MLRDAFFSLSHDNQQWALIAMTFGFLALSLAAAFWWDPRLPLEMFDDDPQDPEPRDVARMGDLPADEEHWV